MISKKCEKRFAAWLRWWLTVEDKIWLEFVFVLTLSPCVSKIFADTPIQDISRSPSGRTIILSTGSRGSEETGGSFLICRPNVNQATRKLKPG